VEDIFKVFCAKAISDIGSIYREEFEGLLNRDDVVFDLKEKSRVELGIFCLKQERQVINATPFP
jgi:hypothetical protein